MTAAVPANGGLRLFGVLLVLVVCLAAVVVADGGGHVIYKDPRRGTEARVRDLLGRMTLEEKIGQMAQIDRAKATEEIMREYSIGSVLSGGGSVPSERATVEDWVGMVNRFQAGSVSSRLGIPMIYGIDAVHGNSNVYKATIFPHNVGLGATRGRKIRDNPKRKTEERYGTEGVPFNKNNKLV